MTIRWLKHEKVYTLQLRESFSFELMFFRLREASSLSCPAAADFFVQTVCFISTSTNTTKVRVELLTLADLIASGWMC